MSDPVVHQLEELVAKLNAGALIPAPPQPRLPLHCRPLVYDERLGICRPMTVEELARASG